MNEERLAPLHLLPPPTARPWHAMKHRSTGPVLRRSDVAESRLKLPLFWYAPDWYQLAIETANALAAAVGRSGVAVAALRSEIATSDMASPLHDRRVPRMVPYRPERYGFQVGDLDDAAVIDVRLTLARSPSGRFAYPRDQVARWESDSGDAAVSGGGWVEAASFPPDVKDLTHLGSKIAQLRGLSPDAAVFVSINPIDLETELPDVLDADPDGIILRMDRFHLTGLQLASIVVKVLSIMRRRHFGDLPLWVVPGEISPDDAAKLMALGAGGVAIDTWCHGLREEAFRPPASAATRLGFVDAHAQTDDAYVDSLVDSHLGEKLERFSGLLSSTFDGDLSQRLGSFDETWATSLGVRSLS